MPSGTTSDPRRRCKLPAVGGPTSPTTAAPARRRGRRPGDGPGGHPPRRGPATRGDEILLRLVDLARDDELAGRLVVQRLLPALISRTRRYAPFQRSVDPIEIVVGAAWLAVRAYDTGRRRHNVASSLGAGLGVHRVPSAVPPTVGQRDRAPDRPLRDDAQRRGRDDSVRGTGRSGPGRTPGRGRAPGPRPRSATRPGRLPGVVAQQRGVTPRTIRNHRDRAVIHIRQALDAA